MKLPVPHQSHLRVGRAGEPATAGNVSIRAVPRSGRRLTCSLRHSGQQAAAPAVAARRSSRRFTAVGFAAGRCPTAAPHLQPAAPGVMHRTWDLGKACCSRKISSLHKQLPVHCACRSQAPSAYATVHSRTSQLMASPNSAQPIILGSPMHTPSSRAFVDEPQ